jgi:D-glycerate 3-kinase
MINSNLITILQKLSINQEATTEEIQLFLKEELSDLERAKAFGITLENVKENIEARSHLFFKVYPEVMQLCREFGFKNEATILTTLWELWLPLAMQLAEARKRQEYSLVQGILGGQGSGKTTLTAVICLILRHLNCKTVGVSIDDLYKKYSDRQKLRESDPRFIRRGPPGTHDIELGIELLDRLRQSRLQKAISLPRFDKSLHEGEGDRIESVLVNKIDILLFEGWFVGAHPVDESIFENAPSPIDTLEDRQFARDINRKLQDYLALWERLDRLIVLYPTDYHYCKQWRREAEHKIKAANNGRGMSDKEIDEFVDYFWRSLHPELFITPLTKNGDRTNMVIEIDINHCPGKVYQPETLHHSQSSALK